MRAARALVAIGAVAVAAMTPGRVQAQGSSAPRCSVSPAIFNGSDACQKATDLFHFVAPQVGVAVAGGNPMPGDAGSLGGFGRRALSVRLVGVDAMLPRNTVPISVTGQSVPSDFGAARAFIPMPSADLGVGLFPGVPVGLSNVGGVDLLLGVTYLPSASRDEFAITPENGGFGFAYGLRVGLLQESSLVPGVSVSFQRRELPRSEFRYTPGNDTLQVGANMATDALRLVVSKRLALFGLAAGVGQDKIDGRSSMTAVVNETVSGAPVRSTATLTGLRESTRRNTAFVNASFSFVAFRIVGEYGWSSAGTLRETVNTFGGRRANEGYRFGSLGITARF